MANLAGLMPPGARGYLEAEGAAQEAGVRNLANIQHATQIRGALEKLSLEQNMRAELAQADTPEKQAAVALKYGGPNAIMGHLDRQAGREQTKQLALSRLSQVAANAENVHEREMRRLTKQEDRDAEIARHNSVLEQINAERLKYDTGSVVNVPGRVQSQSQPQVAPVPPPPAAPMAQPVGMMGAAQLNAIGPQSAVTNPQMAADAARIQQAETQPNGGGMIPVTKVIPDARVTGATPVSGAAPTTPEMPPIIANSPKKIQDKWLADQAKAQQKALTVNMAGGRESMMINRVIGAGNQATRDLENVTKLPLSTASRGIFGGRGQEQGIFNAGAETLANKMTTQEVQSYNVLATGFQRTLAAIEAFGLMPSGALTHQMDALIFREGDSNFTKLQKLAQTRQIIEAGLETTASNPRVDPETKKHISDITAKLNKAVPFTNEDLIKLQQQQKINPNVTLGDIVKMKESSGAAPYSDPDKERRYQEWKAKQGG